MGQMTMFDPAPNSLSRMSWSQTTRGSPSSSALSFMPWSAVSATVAPSSSKRPKRLSISA